MLSLISWTCFWFNIFIKLFAFSKHLLQSFYEILFIYNVSNLRKHCQKNNCSWDWAEKGDCTLLSMFFMLVHISNILLSSAKSYFPRQDKNSALFFYHLLLSIIWETSLKVDSLKKFGLISIPKFLFPWAISNVWVKCDHISPHFSHQWFPLISAL